MRLIKMFGLAAAAALAAMAFVGATSASATFNTSLCKVNTALVCQSSGPDQRWGPGELIHIQTTGTAKLLGSLTVLCLTVLGLLETEEKLATAPAKLKVEGEFDYLNCGTNAAHTNCDVEEKEEALFELLKTAAGLAEGTGVAGKVFVECENIFGFIDVECEYNASNLAPHLEGNHVTLDEDPVTIEEGDFLCPEEPKADALLSTLESEASSSYTSLCKTHTGPCAKKDRAKSLHLASTKPPVLYNTIANVECESSLAAATVLAAAEPQKVDVTELTWKGCHTQGAADNCTVASTALPTIDLKGTALNLGEATTLGLKIGIDCLVLGLIELDCVYDGQVTLPVEGALHKEGTGHGKLTASKVVLKKLSGEGHCPESVKWDATYEFSEHLYVIPWTVESKGRAYITS